MLDIECKHTIYIDLARAKSEASVFILMIKAIKFKSNNMNSKPPPPQKKKKKKSSHPH